MYTNNQCTVHSVSNTKWHNTHCTQWTQYILYSTLHRVPNRCQIELSQWLNWSTALTRRYTLTSQYVGIQKKLRGAKREVTQSARHPRWEHDHCDWWFKTTWYLHNTHCTLCTQTTNVLSVSNTHFSQCTQTTNVHSLNNTHCTQCTQTTNVHSVNNTH